MGYAEIGAQYFAAINKTAAKFMKHGERVKPHPCAPSASFPSP
jgi:hypothetical protein